ncbi:MAG TPA: outer membrane beta-barrel protein, partial [Chitinophagaceae bacterium]|nr:outer membrane beta-barrel protein [Chitinophagaceae bacterium]
KDSAVIKFTAAGKTGSYSFEPVHEGAYLVSVTSVGTEKAFSALFTLAAGQQLELPAIQLRAAAKAMTGVTVQSRRPLIETKLDKTVVNVDASPTNAGATALEVLEKSPGVMVNNDGLISLRGKQGVIVMIDGKPTYLSATDLANMLKNMPASALDQIEIMTNPSSKYDASGNSGIINIKTKKGKTAGFNGTLMVGATSSIYKPNEAVYFIPKSQNSFTFNYRKNKINLFGNYNPNFFRGRNQQLIDRNFADTVINQRTDFRFRGDNHTVKLGLDWFADKNNVFGVVLGGFGFFGHPNPSTTTDKNGKDGRLGSRMMSTAANDITFKNFTANINWKHNFDSAGQDLTADADYLTYDNLSNMLLVTDNYDASGHATAPTFFLKGNLPSGIYIYSFKSDYVKPFKSGRFEAGVKTSFVKNDNLVDYQMKAGDKWVPDARSNHFIYEENINAAYVNANRQFKKWTFQGGLRVENTIARGHQITNNIKFDRNITSLFPSAFASYEMNEKNKLTASYSRRITRPNYQNLNPFVYFLDSLTYMQGNPNLLPQYTHNMEVSHAFKGKYITTLAYNNTTDVISQMLKQNTAEKKTFMTFENVAKLNSISLSITAPFTFAKWWNGNLFTTVFNNHYKGIYNNKPIDMSATSFTANLTNTFTLGKGYTAEISGFYRHKGIDQLALMQPIYQMSFGGQKQVLKGKGTVRLNVRDPFAWQRFR